jgi:tRNA pseudouridine38-40 synthase
MMRNIALRLEYDGTDFVGSQWQSNGRSVQAALEEAWQQLTQEHQRLTLAGRTDAGVHARGQVGNVLTETRHDPATIRRGLNAHLPEDVGVIAVWEAHPRFHARHSAVRRDYRYLINNRRDASPLLRHYALHVERKLDLAAVNAALQALIGAHDFAAFTTSAQEGSTVRTLQTAVCHEIDFGGQRLLAVDLAANAFLHHMVRNIVGTVLLAGFGKLDAAGIAAVLAGRDRRKAGQMAPAHGLYLMSVTYPDQVERDHEEEL